MADDQVLESKPKLPASAHFLCGWPIILVAIGGAIGGALGGAAYGINLSIYRSKMPVAAKVALNVLTGVLAFLLWIVAASLIQGAINS